MKIGSQEWKQSKPWLRSELLKDIAELEFQLAEILACQQFTTNSARVENGRFMEVEAIKAIIKREKQE